MSSQTYRAMVRTATGQFIPVDVEAATGDEAAEAALRQQPGGFVTNITPAPQRAQLHVPKAEAAA